MVNAWFFSFANFFPFEFEFEFGKNISFAKLLVNAWFFICTIVGEMHDFFNLLKIVIPHMIFHLQNSWSHAWFFHYQKLLVNEYTWFLFICKIVGQCMNLFNFHCGIVISHNPLTTKKKDLLMYLSKFCYKDYWILGGTQTPKSPDLLFGPHDMCFIVLFVQIRDKVLVLSHSIVLSRLMGVLSFPLIPLFLCFCFRGNETKIHIDFAKILLLQCT